MVFFFLKGLIQLIFLLYWNSYLRRKWSQELLHLLECFGLGRDPIKKKQKAPTKTGRAQLLYAEQQKMQVNASVSD